MAGIGTMLCDFFHYEMKLCRQNKSNLILKYSMFSMVVCYSYKHLMVYGPREDFKKKLIDDAWHNAPGEGHH